MRIKNVRFRRWECGHALFQNQVFILIEQADGDFGAADIYSQIVFHGIIPFGNGWIIAPGRAGGHNKSRIAVFYHKKSKLSSNKLYCVDILRLNRYTLNREAKRKGI